jgi:sec-independent protein translocase protein TatA
MEEGDDSDKKVEDAKPAADAAAEDVVEEPAESDADAADEGAVYCTHCGHKNEAGAEFCAKCGKPLSK